MEKKLADTLAKAEAKLLAEFNDLAFPNGREAAWERINRMCELSPAALGSGQIDRSSPNLWRTRPLGLPG